MALNVSGLQAAVAQLTTDVNALIAVANQLLANQPDPTAQAKVDAVTASLAALDSSVAAAVTADTPPAPTGTTGASGPAPAPSGTTGP